MKRKDKARIKRKDKVQIRKKVPAKPKPGNKSLEIQVLQERVLAFYKEHERSAKALGTALIALREAMRKNGKHGDFTRWWRSKGLKENRVYYCIDVAKGKKKSKFDGVTVTPPPIPYGTYKVIYADPPWPYDSYSSDKYTSVHDHYPTMSLDAICKMKTEIPPTTNDAVLFLWTTTVHLFNAKQVLDAWGFKYKTIFTWAKKTVKNDLPRAMPGKYNRATAEFLLLATKGEGMTVEALKENGKTKLRVASVYDGSFEGDPEGDPRRQPMLVIPPEKDSRKHEAGQHRVRWDGNWFDLQPCEHSRKPFYYRELIDRLYPEGPRIELFARGILPSHWDGWGNEFVPGPEQMKRELAALQEKRLRKQGEPLFENLGVDR